MYVISRVFFPSGKHVIWNTDHFCWQNKPVQREKPTSDSTSLVLWQLLQCLWGVLWVFWGCCNTDWVAYTVEMNFLLVLEAGSPKSRHLQGWFWEPLGKDLSSSSLLSLSMVVSSLSLLVFVCLLLSLLFPLCVNMSRFSLLIGSPVISSGDSS